MKERKLPSKPSRIIEMALEDLEKVEKSKGYSVDMGTWAQMENAFKSDSGCSVCFAGAVMSQRTLAEEFKKDKSRGTQIVELLPYSGSSPNRYAYHALDSCRKYEIESALEDFLSHSKNKAVSSKLEKILDDFSAQDFFRKVLRGRSLLSHRWSPVVFKTNMRKIAKEFKRLGI